MNTHATTGVTVIFRPDMEGRGERVAREKREASLNPSPVVIVPQPPAAVFTPPLLPPPEEASLLVKWRRLNGELKAWREMGAPIAAPAVRAARAAACEACDYYFPKGNLGLGECRAPGCGCSRAKRWLQTAKCPHPLGSQWPDVST